MATQLRFKLRILRSPFESGVVKVQAGGAHKLTDPERDLLRVFELDDNNSDSDTSTKEHENSRFHALNLLKNKRQRL
ncbi:hypothetical protein ACHHYP_20270 [Achlya hypogyna]|uniref:Uncharacterized protein n=1 Tax=Achlya hypogyna TaxID=1202772 RepID=A0A1V9YUH6_ACHHY|nr:hypothetical protein ACHHYP_20270 [Achlya hypogyna]